MYFDTAMVLAGGLGTALAFGLFRLYMMWRRWSNASKENDEIDWDRKIANAIKQGDVELIAKLRKYFLNYKRDGARSDDTQSKFFPDTLYLCKEGKFWFTFDKDGIIQILKPLKRTYKDDKEATVLKMSTIGENGEQVQKKVKRFKTFNDLSDWLKTSYKLGPM